MSDHDVRYYPVVLERSESVILWVEADDPEDAAAQIDEPGEWWDEGEFFDASYGDPVAARGRQRWVETIPIGPTLGCAECGSSAPYVGHRLHWHEPTCGKRVAA